MALEVVVEAERSVPDGIAIASKYKKTEGCTLLADVFALLCHLSAPDHLTFGFAPTASLYTNSGVR